MGITKRKRRHFSTPLLDIFGESPFGKFVHHAKIVNEATDRLHTMLGDYLDAEYEEIPQSVEKILALAIEADEVRSDLMLHLPKRLILPIPREELLLLMRGQDRIAAFTYNAAFQLSVRHTLIPPPIQGHMHKHLDTVSHCVEILLNAEEAVDRLLQTAFTRRSAEKVTKLVNRGLVCERRADHLKEEAIIGIFQQSAALGTLGAYHLLKLVELIDKIAHHAKHTGVRLASIISRDE